MSEHSIPMTRPVTILIHEQAYESLRTAAEEKTKGSISKYIRLLVYRELLSQHLIPIGFMEQLYGKQGV